MLEERGQTLRVRRLVLGVHRRVGEVAARDATLSVRALLEIGLAQVSKPATLAPIDQRREAERTDAEIIPEAHRIVGTLGTVELFVTGAIRIEAVKSDDFVGRVANLYLRARGALAEAATGVEGGHWK